MAHKLLIGRTRQHTWELVDFLAMCCAIGGKKPMTPATDSSGYVVMRGEVEAEGFAFQISNTL